MAIVVGNSATVTSAVTCSSRCLPSSVTDVMLATSFRGSMSTALITATFSLTAPSGLSAMTILSLRCGNICMWSPMKKVFGMKARFTVLRGQGKGTGVLVSDDVVHEGGPTGTWIPEPHGLDGSRSQGKYFIPGPLGVAVHIDKDVDTVLVDSVSSFAVTLQGREVHKVFCLLANL